MQRTSPVLLVATLTALALLGKLPAARANAGAAGLGPVVRCEPCDELALAQCAPPPATCAELVREPGCGCCLTCARREGQRCGIYTERCGAGLRCHPQPGESRPLQALLEGRGLCANTSAEGHQRAPPQPAPSAPGEPPAPGASPQRPGGGTRGRRLGMGVAAAETSLLSLLQRSYLGRPVPWREGARGRDPPQPLARFSECRVFVNCKALLSKMGQ